MSDNSQTKLSTLFFTFFKIGIMTFGGGYAMLPILQREVVEKNHWATEEELVDYFAIGQCTPGIIAVNVATFIGYKKRGILGAVLTTFGIVCPCLLIITALASFLKAFQHNIYLQKAFKGIRVAVCALIGNSVIKLCKKSVNSVFGAIEAVLAFCVELVFKVPPVLITLSTIVIGLVLFVSKKKKGDAK